MGNEAISHGLFLWRPMYREEYSTVPVTRELEAISYGLYLWRPIEREREEYSTIPVTRAAWGTRQSVVCVFFCGDLYMERNIPQYQ